MKHSPPRSAKAFTLIEVMLAATLMVAGVVGAIQVLVSGSEMLETSRKQAVALQIIDSEIAKMHVTSWTQIATLPTTKTATVNSTKTKLLYTTSGTTFDTIDTVVPVDSTFSCQRAVTVVRKDASNNPLFDQITFTVTWNNRSSGRAYTRTGTTYVGKYGLYVSYQR